MRHAAILNARSAQRKFSVKPGALPFSTARAQQEGGHVRIHRGEEANMTTRHSRRAIVAWTLLAGVLAGLVAAATALAAPPRESSQPTIEGGPFRQGATLRAGNGIWTNNPTSFAYRWQRCDANGNNCGNIAGATAQTYRLVQADVGQTVRLLVTARNADGARTANSKPSPVIADNAAPRPVVEPTISGTPAVGQELTANPGTWSNLPDRFAYQWKQCDATGAACAAIAGATGTVFGVRSADLGRTLRVEVTAVNSFGRTKKESNNTGIVRASAGGGSGTTVSIASVSLPERLVISAVSFSPSAIHNRADLVTMRVRVTDTRNRLVQGALVLADAIPFGRVNTSAETATDANGIATITFRPTIRLPIVRNTAVQFFLRARKAGEDVLAGVSTRRLIQVRVVPG
jgi:hypothetical protein